MPLPSTGVVVVEDAVETSGSVVEFTEKTKQYFNI